MKPAHKTTLICLSLILLAYLVVWRVQTWQRAQWKDQDPFACVAEVTAPRIVSLVPSVTEMVCMLGYGNHLVGRSTFCDFPEEVQQVPSVGSLSAIQVEAIARLKPDFVLLSDSASMQPTKAALDQLKISHLAVPVNTMEEIYQSIWDLAERLNATETASIWLEQLNTSIAQAQAKKPTTAPRVLICVGRSPNSLERLYISGKSTFYSDILQLVGASNAYTGPVAYPMITQEGLLALNPDIIVDIITGDTSPEQVEKAIFQWSRLSHLKAVKTAQVHILTETWAVRPGPRIGSLINCLSHYVQRWNESHDH